MPQLRVTLAESAVRDLASILAWYAEQQVPNVGRGLVDKIMGRIESLASHPDIGRVVPEFETASLRELIEPPFRIVYKREAQRIRIVRVWRSERQLRLED